MSWVTDAIKVMKKVSPTDGRLNYLTLGLCGEVGEFTNLIKKRWKGQWISRCDILEELADVYIYLKLIEYQMDCNLDKLAKEKTQKNMKHFDVK